jgi:hypothetical protein
MTSLDSACLTSNMHTHAHSPYQMPNQSLLGTKLASRGTALSRRSPDARAAPERQADSFGFINSRSTGVIFDHEGQVRASEGAIGRRTGRRVPGLHSTKGKRELTAPAISRAHPTAGLTFRNLG